LKKGSGRESYKWNWLIKVGKDGIINVRCEEYGKDLEDSGKRILFPIQHISKKD
jgi:hypothetical protein